MDILKQPNRADYFHGILALNETDKGLLPMRFTPAQMAVYSESEGRELRARSGAGVSLQFETDSESVALEFHSERGARQWLFVDLHVNGILAGHAGQAKHTAGPGTAQFALPAGRNRVSLCLPHSRELFLKSVRLAPGSSTEPVPRPAKKLLCLGDSITQGMSALYASNTYTHRLAASLNADLLNQGVGGYIFCERSLDPGLPFKPDLITVAYGTNDWNHFETDDAFRGACRAYLRNLADCCPAARIAVLTPLWRADLAEDKPMGPFQLVADIIREECAAVASTEVVDGLRLVPHTPEYFADKRVHPNDLGFMHYAANLIQAIGACS